MSILDKVKKGRVKKPLFMVMYSGPGVGKTDFAASFPKPLFFDFEESTHNINVDRIDNLQKYSEVMNGLHEILEKEPGSLEFKSIIFDTIDELERMMHVQIASDAGKKSIDHIGWQKGFDYAVNLWAEVIGVCRMIRDKHNIHFLFLAHSAHKSKDDIEKEQTYMRNTINLHKKSAAFVFGAVEMVLYAKKDISFKKDGDGNVFAKDSNKRSLCTSLSAHYDAKNRLQLDPVMPMPVRNGFAVIWTAYEKAFSQTPEQAIELCMKAMESVNDEDLKKQMIKYIQANKTDIMIIRTALLRINEIIGEQE
jgi:hypothetical protein